ncbi:hypothetical protein F2Q68_00038360 [Brassica cretica]|uniref:Uncharacterized protein n=1 Tax=Brassica cretica TaxID=69181 RepID=A0A8S9ME61_BRACR|nr:hypothetical protein F2Q68_00038360 [Brassica cretica]
MPPASPIEDRGTAIPIEDRDRVIPERLRLCGVTSRKDHSARGTVGAGVDWTSFAKDSFSRYMNVTSRKDHSACGTVGAGVDWTSFAKDSFSIYMNRKVVRACSCLIVA